MNGSKPRSSSELNLGRPGGGLGSLLKELEAVDCVANIEGELKLSSLKDEKSEDGSTTGVGACWCVVRPSRSPHCINGAGASWCCAGAGIPV